MTGAEPKKGGGAKEIEEMHRQANCSAVHAKMPSPAAWFKNSTDQH